MSPATFDLDEQLTTELQAVPGRWLRAWYFDPKFKESVIAQLDRLSELRAGWDGYNAPPIDASIIEAAKQVVLDLQPHLTYRPTVVPMSSGALQFEWHDGDRTLELEFENATTIHYLRWDPHEDIRDENFIPTRDLKAVETLIKWFMNVGA